MKTTMKNEKSKDGLALVPLVREVSAICRVRQKYFPHNSKALGR